MKKLAMILISALSAGTTNAHLLYGMAVPIWFMQNMLMKMAKVSQLDCFMERRGVVIVI